MATQRIKKLDGIEIRPQLSQIFVRYRIDTEVDGEVVLSSNATKFINKEDDLSDEDPLLQSIANYYWSTLQ
jgi:hypothetical protein